MTGCTAKAGALAAGLGLAAGPVHAAGLLTPWDAWETLSLPGEAMADFRLRGGTLRVRAASAFGVAYRPVEPVCSPCRRLTWRWRVESRFAASDQGAKHGDDRALGVYLWFDTGAQGKTLYGDLAELWGYPTVTHAIGYVWGGRRERGTWLTSPYFARGKLVVLRGPDAPRGTWLRERRDLAADIRRAFGDAVSLADLEHIAVAADTDNTDRTSRARLRALSVR